MKKHSFQRNSKSFLGSLVFGILLSVLLLFGFCAIFALIISKLENPMGILGGATLAALILSGALSAFITVKRRGDGGFSISLLSSSAVSVILLVAGLIAGGGKIPFAPLMNALCYLLVSFFFAWLASRKRKRRIRR